MNIVNKKLPTRTRTGCSIPLPEKNTSNKATKRKIQELSIRAKKKSKTKRFNNTVSNRQELQGLKKEQRQAILSVNITIADIIVNKRTIYEKIAALRAINAKIRQLKKKFSSKK